MFELDDVLINEIIFYMENQEGEFYLDTQKGSVVSLDNNNDDDKYIPIPEWSPADGYRLMEKFTSELKNPLARQELSQALNRSKGVFRAFKNTVEQYPEIEKLWFAYKEQKMKEEVLSWYDSLRAESGIKTVGSEPEDNSSLVLEDFVFREGRGEDKGAVSRGQGAVSSEQGVVSREQLAVSSEEVGKEIFEKMNPFVFPGDVSVVAESVSGDIAGFVCGVKDSPLILRICRLEVMPEYRGMGLGKTLLSKFLEKIDKNQSITIDLPASSDYFSRALLLENFKPCVQRFILKKE
jgi:ribosomal protein S18 acetylase RimI-like enzyme